MFHPLNFRHFATTKAVFAPDAPVYDRLCAKFGFLITYSKNITAA
ncbi:MAG: hypothetical protein AAF960_00660 [Bacteroidota bacterium]